MRQVHQQWVTNPDGTRYPNRTKTTLPISQCGTKFKFDNYTKVSSRFTLEVEALGINDYSCIDVDNFNLTGQFFSDIYEYMDIKFEKCNPAYRPDCKTPT